MEAATGYSRRVEATALKCLSMDSATRFTSVDNESRSGTIFPREWRMLSRGSSPLGDIWEMKNERKGIVLVPQWLLSAQDEGRLYQHVTSRIVMRDPHGIALKVFW